MAMAGAGAERDALELELELEKLLECPICMEPFTDPKMLSCYHTFCEKCLQDLYNNSGRSGNLYCPTCRKQTSVPADGITGVPNDFKMNEMKDVIGRVQTRVRPQGNVSNPSQTRPGDNACNPCQASNQIVPATWRCIHCEMMYCEDCMDVHNSHSLFKRHEVLRLHQSTVTWGMCEVRLK
ncbi:hypothetical protein NP493_2055g00005 [Ridgeia piscesae]|uniref:RING-type domain-containing protein n=1 Tax=Ridgeia piscesae TaxID=27915 RepID=A0AAD9JM01_RIDPI|nr:hypothetical protein NP493_2055g00005 [Ridgeia piscesae]